LHDTFLQKIVLTTKIMSGKSNDNDAIDSALEKLKPVVSKLTIGSIIGYCSGAATKKVGKAIAIVMGVGFMIVQSAVYSGYVAVDWKKVKKDAVSKVDTDGDGKLTVDDVKNYWKKIKTILTTGVPDASGFSVGFLYGLRVN